MWTAIVLGWLAMNIRAAKFVQNLRGLSSTEKCVAQNMAVYADYKNAIAYMSMATLAEDSDLHRQNVVPIVKRLEAYGIIRPVTGAHTKGGRGHTTPYAFTFTVNRDFAITVKSRRKLSVTADTLPTESVWRGEPKVSGKTPETVCPSRHEGFEGIGSALFESAQGHQSSSSEGRRKPDDDDGARAAHKESEPQTPETQTLPVSQNGPGDHLVDLQQKAIREIVRRGESKDVAQSAVIIIDARAARSETVPYSVKYFIQGYEAMRENGEIDEVRQQVERGRQLRDSCSTAQFDAESAPTPEPPEPPPAGKKNTRAGRPPRDIFAGATKEQLAAFAFFATIPFGCQSFRFLLADIYDERKPGEAVVTLLRRSVRRCRLWKLKVPRELRVLVCEWDTRSRIGYCGPAPRLPSTVAEREAELGEPERNRDP